MTDVERYGAEYGVEDVSYELAQGLTPERAVIAAVVLDSRVLRFALDECEPRDMEDTRLGQILNGVAEMVARREPVDVITVGAKLLDWDVRGITEIDLHRWIADLPTAQNVGYYAALVRKTALRRGLTQVAVKLGQQAQKLNPGSALAEAIDALGRLRDGSAARVSEAKLLGQVLEVPADEDEYDWVIPDLLERRDRLILTGSEGGGKTTLVRQMAVLAAAGIHPLQFYATKPAKVLVVDVENSEKQWRRQVRGMAETARLRGTVDPAQSLVLDCTSRMDITRDQDLGMLHKLVDQVRPDILFIGPLYRLTPGAITDDDDAAPVLSALDTLRDRGLALVIEAHAGHGRAGDGDRDLRPRGSSALLGWPEFGLGLRPNKQAKGGPSIAAKEFQLVRWRGDRDERKWPHLIARGQDSGFPWTPTYPGGTR